MSYGVRTWSSNGVLEMDTDSFTYQVLHNQLYTTPQGGVLNIPVQGFTPDKCSAVMLPVSAPPNDYVMSAMPFIYLGNGVITIRSQNVNGGGYTGSGLQFRLLVMRLRN